MYFSKSFSISLSSNGVSIAFIIPNPIKSPTICVASTSIRELIFSGDEFLEISIIWTSSSWTSSTSAFGVSWIVSSCSWTTSDSDSGSSSGNKANLSKSSSSSVKPDDAVLTSKPNSFAWKSTSAEAISNSLAIWWIRFFAIYSSSFLASSVSSMSSWGESPKPSMSIL